MSEQPPSGGEQPQRLSRAAAHRLSLYSRTRDSLSEKLEETDLAGRIIAESKITAPNRPSRQPALRLPLGSLAPAPTAFSTGIS